MRALRIHKFGGPENLKLENIPIPPVGDSEVLVRVHAAGINPVDTYIREGAYAALPTLPAVLGREVAGQIEETGKNVSKFKVSEFNIFKYVLFITMNIACRSCMNYRELENCL